MFDNNTTSQIIIIQNITALKTTLKFNCLVVVDHDHSLPSFQSLAVSFASQISHSKNNITS